MATTTMSDAYGGMPDISQLTPATGRVGQPASGTYGEGAPLADLQRQLPAPTAPPQGMDAAPSPAGGLMPEPPPGGALPRSLMPGSVAPTTRPSEAPSTPLTMPTPIAETPSEQQIQRLEAWARDPNVSETTRAWAQSILDSLER
jgi:hypothetical protein